MADVFRSKQAALTWLYRQEEPARPPKQAPTIVRAPASVGHSVRSRPPVPRPSPSTTQLERDMDPDETVIQALRAERTARGTVDPSTGDVNKIYGVVHTNPREMEAKLGLPGMDRNLQSGLINRGVDLGALPGMYGSGEDDNGASGDANEISKIFFLQLSHRASEEQGYDAAWKLPSKHALRRVKSGQDLYDLTSSYKKQWVQAETAQNVKWKCFLAEAGYSAGVSEEFLSSGLLPLMIRRTAKTYEGLLDVAVALLYNSEGPLIWKGSRAEALLTHHSRKLALIRQDAPNYRSHLYQTYVYLREAAAQEGYRHHAMFDGLFERMQSVDLKLAAKDKSGGGGGGGGGTEITRCSHCHTTGFHDKGKDNCPGKDLSQAIVRKILKNLPASTEKAKLRIACETYATRIAAEPTGDIDQIIKEVRRTVLNRTN